MSIEASVSLPGPPAPDLTSHRSMEQLQTISSTMTAASPASSELSSITLLSDFNFASGAKDVGSCTFEGKDKREAKKRPGGGSVQASRMEKAKRTKIGKSGETREKGIYCHLSDSITSVMTIEN